MAEKGEADKKQNQEMKNKMVAQCYTDAFKMS